MSSGFWIGFWVFMTAVLLLVVFHPGFRRFAVWAAGSCAVVSAIGALVWWYHTRTAAHRDGGFDLSTARPICEAQPTSPGCPVPQSDMPNPPAAAPREVTDPAILYQLNDCKTHPTNPGCPAYNPHDPAQLKEHLAECAPTPNAPEEWKRSPAVADRRGIPCNVFDQFDEAPTRRARGAKE